MMTIGILLIFVWIITSFIVVVDMFKKHVAIGCLGLILISVLPFFWVFKGYSGNKKRMAIILYSSAILGFSIFGYLWIGAKDEIVPFIKASEEAGIHLSLNSIGFRKGSSYYALVSKNVHTPKGDFASVQEMLELIEKDVIEELSNYYPTSIEPGTILRLAIQTKSGFIVIYEISGPGQIDERYTVSSYEDL